MQAEPDETDLKRKAMGKPIGATAEPSNGIKKPKAQEKWSCALCHVTATSEQALNDHLQGKKHKSQENGLNSQRVSFCTSPLPKTGNASTGKPIKAKPDETDVERKATGKPIGATVEPSNGIKKPKTQDWSCALCRVTATSEQALNDHLQGKMHKSRENGLNSQGVGFCTGPLRKTGNVSTWKPIKVPGATNKPVSKKQDKKAGGETLLGKVDKAPAQKLPGIDNKITLLQGKETFVKKENKEPQKSPASTTPKKKFEFMCEICQVGAYSLEVMNSHKKGKRHLAKVNGLNKPDQATSSEMRSLKKGAAKELEVPDPIIMATTHRLHIVVEVLLAILLPPVGVCLRTGCCSCEFLICLLLTLLGYIPGIIYAIYVIVVKNSVGETGEGEYHALPQ